MNSDYCQYRTEIINDILFQLRMSDMGSKKSDLDFYLNKIYSNKLGSLYNEIDFDITVYFIYEELKKEKLIEIKNGNSWILLTERGKNVSLKGYNDFQKNKHEKSKSAKDIFSLINISSEAIKNIIKFLLILTLLSLLLISQEKWSKVLDLLRSLKDLL
jgi:hypothetical protein|nr:MAG TPA: hypothetical protein [Caudoviricetes sp.]